MPFLKYFIVSLLFFFYVGIGRADNFSFERAFTSGMRAYQSEDYEQAALYFKKALDEDPDFYDTYYMLGISYTLAHDYKKGELILKKAIDRFPTQWQAYGVLGDIYAVNDQFSEALAVYQTAMKQETFPSEEILIFQKKIRLLNDQQEAYLKKSKALKNNLSARVKIDLDPQWSSVFASKNKDNWLLEYGLTGENVEEDQWSQLVTVQCMGKNALSPSFEELEKRISRASSHLKTLSKDEKTALYEVNFEKNKKFNLIKLVDYPAFVCVIQYASKEKLTPQQSKRWTSILKDAHITE